MVFADTSALIKLLLDEPHCDAVRHLFSAADIDFALCRLAWVEAHSGLARRARLVPADEPGIMRARHELARIWPHFSVVEVTERLTRRAGDHAEAFALRAYDAVQLAAAHELALAGGTPLTFACFDKHLNRAARTLGFEVPFADLR